MKNVRAIPSDRSDAIRVLIVEDHHLVAEGLTTTLAASAEFLVVGHADSIRALSSTAPGADPDVVLMDFRLPDGSGIAACGLVRDRWPNAQVVVLTAAADKAVVQESVRAGCIGFVTKDRRVDDIRAAVRAAARGQISIPSHLLTELVAPPAAPDPAGQPTKRELQVLQMIAEGTSTEAVAARLYLSPHTIRNHLRRAMGKLGAHQRLEAVMIAAARGLVSLPAPPPTPRWVDGYPE